MKLESNYYCKLNCELSALELEQLRMLIARGIDASKLHDDNVLIKFGTDFLDRL